MGVAALADVVPYCTVKALDHDKPNRKTLVDALVHLLYNQDEPGNISTHSFPPSLLAPFPSSRHHRCTPNILYFQV